MGVKSGNYQAKQGREENNIYIFSKTMLFVIIPSSQTHS